MIFHAEPLVGGGENHFFAFRLQAGLNEDGFHTAPDGRRAAQSVGGIKGAMEHRSEAADDDSKDGEGDDDFQQHVGPGAGVGRGA